MYKILVEKECGCFRKSDLENSIEIPSKDDALSKAIYMKNFMNEEFCGKHKFELVEKSNNFVISFKLEQNSSCCQTGCC